VVSIDIYVFVYDPRVRIFHISLSPHPRGPIRYRAHTRLRIRSACPSFSHISLSPHPRGPIRYRAHTRLRIRSACPSFSHIYIYIPIHVGKIYITRVQRVI
jgi:hypothetical protein